MFEARERFSYPAVLSQLVRQRSSLKVEKLGLDEVFVDLTEQVGEETNPAE